MAVSNSNLNTYAQFPNLDQLSKEERGMFIKEHNFETSLSTMVAELNTLINSTGSSSSDIDAQKTKINTALNTLTGDIESTLHDLVKRYINLISDETTSVQAAKERIYAKIQNVIQSINVNIQNRTLTYDAVMGYKLRILDAIYDMYGTFSPYSDKRQGNSEYFLKMGNKYALRDIDEGIGYRSCSLSIDPSISQGEVIKICSWDSVDNGTDVPTFLAEVIISGDLYAFKGLVSSSNKNQNGDRTVIFDADYFVNQDLSFAIKVFYDKTNKKTVLGLVYDTTSDGFTSIIKLDFSINLLVGSNLDFAPNCTKMANAGILTFPVNVDLENLDCYNAAGETLVSQYDSDNNYIGSAKATVLRVQSGSSVTIKLAIPDKKDTEYTLPNIYTDEYLDYIVVKVNGVERTITNNDEGDTRFYLSSGLLVINNVDGIVNVVAKAAAISK